MDQARKEPSLADLEAFERLLRDSLQHERAGQAPKPEAVAAPAAPPAPSPNDQGALAELSRLSSAPLSFELPDFGEALPGAPAPAAEAAPQPALQGTANASIGPDWSAMAEVLPSFTAEAERTIYAPRRAEQPVPAAPEVDPLKAFEEELRRFDAANGYAPPPAGAEMPKLRTDYPGYAEPAQTIVVPDSDPSWQVQAPPVAYPEPALSAADQSLADAEAKLAAEAAAVAAASETAKGGGRSKMIFYALGGIAVAGLAAIGASLAFGGKKTVASKDVPVIAAKTEPAKEKPANPGGIEIPDQNKQILAAKTAPAETKPAQVVNTTEQPMDLNQVTKRESVRVIAPNPYQTQPAAPAQPDSAAAAPAAAAPAPAAAPASATPPAPEAKRVQSVRLGDPIMPPKAPPAAAPAPGAIPSIGTAGAAIGGAAAIAAIAAANARPTTPPNAASTTAPAAPKATPPAPPAAATPPAPAKVETRPNTPATTPRVAAPAPAAAPRPAQPAPPKAANAPLQLNPAQRPAQPAARPQQVATAPSSGGGGFAIQLASRPTQADANAASGQLSSRYSAALGGKAARVVSGEANGKTVYRVRVGGYSQAEAAAACERVKAAGGGCFVTRQ